MKNLAILFCSLRPSSKNIETNDLREIEYLNCLKQLIRVIPKNFDIVITENTIDEIDNIKNDELKKLLEIRNTVYLGSSQNNTENIGWGELSMLYNLLDKFSLDKYNFISYVTARRIYTCPYVFEKTNLLKKDALISNPDFYYLDGNYLINPKKGLYNDMFFSMRSEVMIKYANFAKNIIIKNPKYIRYNFIRKKPVGSEQILYEFIKNMKVSYEYLDWLGIIRNQNINIKDYFNIQNFHIC